MSSRIPIAALLVSGTVVAACAANGSQQGRAAEPFEEVTSLVIAPDSMRHSVKFEMRDRGQLYYPEQARHDGVEADAIVAFVIDTAGRIEPRTMTFLEPAPPFEFRRSLCQWKQTVRFTTPLVDGQPRRVLVVQPFGFSLGENSLRSLRLPNTEPYSARLRNAAPSAAVAYLKQLPHCSS